MKLRELTADQIIAIAREKYSKANWSELFFEPERYIFVLGVECKRVLIKDVLNPIPVNVYTGRNTLFGIKTEIDTNEKWRIRLYKEIY